MVLLCLVVWTSQSSHPVRASTFFHCLWVLLCRGLYMVPDIHSHKYYPHEWYSEYPHRLGRRMCTRGYATCNTLFNCTRNTTAWDVVFINSWKLSYWASANICKPLSAHAQTLAHAATTNIIKFFNSKVWMEKIRTLDLEHWLRDWLTHANPLSHHGSNWFDFLKFYCSKKAWHSPQIFLNRHWLLTVLDAKINFCFSCFDLPAKAMLHTKSIAIPVNLFACKRKKGNCHWVYKLTIAPIRRLKIS